MDFFAIVQPGFKQAFLQDIGWLSVPCPIACSFQNTPDGYKLPCTDGIFCEMAIFEEAELAKTLLGHHFGCSLIQSRLLLVI